MKAVNYENIVKKHKKTVEFLAVFLAVLTLITTLQATWITSYADTHDSVSSYLATSGANDWQIVDGQYTGNGSTNKTLSSDDGFVRVQKNVIPTGKENEFYVYTSIDTKEEITQKTYEEFFESDAKNVITYGATQPPNNEKTLGEIYEIGSLGGNSQVQVSANEDNITGSGKTILKRHGQFKITGKESGIVFYVTLYWGGNSNPNNCSFYLKIDDDNCILIAKGVQKNAGTDKANELYNMPDIELSTKAEAAIISKIRTTNEITPVKKLNSIVDNMEDFIQYDGLVAGDYSSVSFKNNVLTWTPAIKNIQPIKEAENANWYCNVAELVYRVKLDVTKSGFNSCANNMNSTVVDKESYPINSKTTLTYDTNKTLGLPVPYVRGLLYEFKFKKVASEDNHVLTGAKFELGGKYSSREVGGGEYIFERLPIGNYTLTETTAPSGYAKSTQTLNVNISGYTADKNSYTHYSDSEYYRLNNNDGNKEMKDDPVTDVKITKVVNGEGGDKEKEFSFTYSTEFGEYRNHETKSDSFKIKDNQTVTLKDLAIGDKLILEEVEDKNYTVKINDQDYSAHLENGIKITKGMEIKVTNTRKTATVTVNKNVDGEIDTDLFEFTYSYSVPGINNNTITNTGTLKVNKNGSNTFEVPTGAEVTLTETTSDDYKIKSVKVGSQSGSQSVTSTNGSFSFEVGSDDVTVTVTNEPVIKNATITVEKIVTGNIGDKNKQFNFTAKVTNGGITTTEDFTLAHDGSYTLTVPIGARLEITENSDGYTAISEMGDSKGNSTFTLKKVEESGTITFTNTLEANINTGITLENVPYIITVFSAVGLLAFMTLKRRKVVEE